MALGRDANRSTTLLGRTAGKNLEDGIVQEAEGSDYRAILGPNGRAVGHYLVIGPGKVFECACPEWR